MKGESPHQYIKQDIIDKWLESVSYDELIENHTAFEPLAFAISTFETLQQLEELQPKLAWKLLHVIRETLEATVQ